MERFSICLAGVSIGVTAELADTRAFCRDFQTDAPPQIHITLTPEDSERARQLHIETDRSEGHIPGQYSPSLLENTALHLRVAEALGQCGIVLFHGCAVAWAGKGYLFCADSGTGKTTHAGLWLKNIPDCHILNGDKPLIFQREDIVYACGTPWKGKERCGTDESLPLAGICLLERSPENHIQRIHFNEGMDDLLHHSYCPGGTAATIKYMQMMQKLSQIPLYRLGCNTEDEAAFVSHAAMAQPQNASDLPAYQRMT